MYYPNLMNMKKNRVYRNRDIEIFDEWLARIPYRNRHNLNYLQFSLDEDINEEIALHLFLDATNDRINILEIYYNVVSDDRMDSLGLYSYKREIPEEIYYPEKNEMMKVKDSNIEVKFKLIAFPASTPSDNKGIIMKKRKAVSPTMEGVKKNNNYSSMMNQFR